VYGYPHSPSNCSKQQLEAYDEYSILKKMRQLKKLLKPIIMKARDTNQLIYIYGDLQDTLDHSRAFFYGNSNIAKHPLGIVHTCENLGLQCTIYQHMDSMSKPVISRHGAKGGRFIDVMYTLPQGLSYIQGITIVTDTGIFSDHHDLVISKFDLGIKRFKISEEKEERIDYKSIMNIPMTIKLGTDHPVINDSVYKGLQYQQHVALYNQIQEICKSPDHGIIDRIEDIEGRLRDFEIEVIDRTENDRLNHVQAIEQSRNKKLYDIDKD